MIQSKLKPLKKRISKAGLKKREAKITRRIVARAERNLKEMGVFTGWR